jgi:hypothetical protein
MSCHYWLQELNVFICWCQFSSWVFVPCLCGQCSPNFRRYMLSPSSGPKCVRCINSYLSHFDIEGKVPTETSSAPSTSTRFTPYAEWTSEIWCFLRLTFSNCLRFAGRAIDQEVSRWLLAATAHVRSQSQVVWNLCFQSGFGFPCQFLSHGLLHTHPSSGPLEAVVTWTQAHPIPRTKNNHGF